MRHAWTVLGVIAVCVLTAPSSIQPQTISVTTPAGGEVFYSGSICPITWEITGEYRLDGRVELLRAGVPIYIVAGRVRLAERHFDWRIAEQIPAGDEYRIRVTDLLQQDVIGESGEFSISSGGIDVVEPDATAVWYRGLEYQIRWVFRGYPGDVVRIDLYKGKSSVVCVKDRIRMDGRRSGVCRWVVPPGTTPGDDYRIRVSVPGRAAIWGESSDFTISAGEIVVTVPRAADILYKGHEYPIKWDFTGHGGRECVVELKRNDVHRVIKPRMRLDSRGLKWVVPIDVPSGDGYRVVVRDFAGVSGESGEFTIENVNERQTRLRIASFFLKEFSNAGTSDEDVGVLADVLKRFDLIALQGVQGSDSDHLMARLVSALKERAEGAEYQCSLSPVTGGEQFAFVVRSEVATVTPAALYGSGTFTRRPYYGTFKKGQFDVTVVTCRLEEGTADETRRAIREGEVHALKGLFENIQRSNGKEEDVVLLGAFFTDPDDEAFNGLKGIRSMRYVISQSTVTTGRGVYDNIWFQSDNLREYTGKSGVYTSVVGKKDHTGAGISDHRPVWAEFSTKGPDDD